MTVIKSHLILGTLVVELACGTVAVSPRSAEAGPKWPGGFVGTSTASGGGS